MANRYKYLLVNKIPNILKGFIFKNSIYGYWGIYPNFGDQLTPEILKFFGFSPIYSSFNPKIPFIKKANFLCVGTLLQNTPENFDGIILGTGMDNVQKQFKKALILGVRGELTKKNLKIKNNICLGDPGLLMSYIYPESVEKKYLLGIIPHFVDKNSLIINKWRKKFGDKVKIIDVQRSPMKVIKDIKQCKNIISSSLHGLIIADAFNIPNIMFAIEETIPETGYHKYIDYYTSLGIDFKVIKATGNESIDYILSKVTSKGKYVEEIQKKLYKKFIELKEISKEYR